MKFKKLKPTEVSPKQVYLITNKSLGYLDKIEIVKPCIGPGNRSIGWFFTYTDRATNQDNLPWFSKEIFENNTNWKAKYLYTKN